MGSEQAACADVDWRYADTITVAVGGLARLVRRGVLDDLRDSSQIHVIADTLDQSSLDTAVTRGVQVAVFDEADIQPLSRSLRALAPRIGLIALAREPTATYGKGLLAWGVSCLDWDVSSADIRAAVHLAVAGGCMFVSRDDRVECSHWQVDGLLTARERAVLERHIAGDSYEQIALALGDQCPHGKGSHRERAREAQCLQ